MKSGLLIAALLGYTRSVLADDSTVSIAAASDPLVETVAPASPSAPLLPFETQQLTDGALEGLNETELALFGFDNGTQDETLGRRTITNCKVAPGDLLWPHSAVWALFDIVLGGALQKPAPKASVCWGNTYDKAKCDAISASWTDSYSHQDDPIEVFNPEPQGMTCQPPSNQYPYITTCTQGGYPVYVVKATNVAHIQLAVNFARATGIRLVVKNTGHDFLGRSTGAGSLSIWTHYLKETKYMPNYVSSNGAYKGPAAKVGAGVQLFELYKFAKANNFVAVGGEAQTVGIGGYLQGGGHSPFSTLRGLGADQILSIDIVTPDGRFTTASATENSDLFWALRGGGGGNWGVVTSYTLRVYPEVPITLVSFTYMTIGPVTSDIFWAGIESFFQRFPEMAAKGTYSYWFIYPNFATGVGQMFILQPLFLAGMGTPEAQAFLAPWLDEMAALGISITPKYESFDSYYEAWQAGFPLEGVMNAKATTASRLIPKSLWTAGQPKSSKVTALVQAYRALAEAGKFVLGFQIQAPLIAGNSENSVNPAWRDAQAHIITIQSWGDAVPAVIKATHERFSNVDMQTIRALTPGSGAYMNEGDRDEPNWQQAFYGSKYSDLLAIKRKYDPRQLFWVKAGVGSEGWTVSDANGLSNENGRLCRV